MRDTHEAQEHAEKIDKGCGCAVLIGIVAALAYFAFRAWAGQ